jgi:hypothetical protein
MNGSPSRVRAGRDSILSQQQQQQLVSAPWQLQQEEDFIADRRVSMTRERHMLHAYGPRRMKGFLLLADVL